MRSHLSANLWLLVITVLLCSVAYPLVLWGFGQTVFHDHAQGSIISKSGKPIGSRLIAQEFKGDQYFQPRPSAASYKADASGASNWGASNYLLRDRVARQLGPIVRYGKGTEKEGQLVGPDIEKWFQKQIGIVAKWAEAHSGLAEQWIKDADSAVKPQWKIGEKDSEPGQAFLQQLAKDDSIFAIDLTIRLLPTTSPSTAEVAKGFFALFPSSIPASGPLSRTTRRPTSNRARNSARAKESPDIQAVFFDMWRQEHPTVALEEVPADMVTASASGLDPDISLKNAQYQLKYRIADARANLIIAEQAKKVRKDFDTVDENGRKTAFTQGAALSKPRSANGWKPGYPK